MEKLCVDEFKKDMTDFIRDNIKNDSETDNLEEIIETVSGNNNNIKEILKTIADIERINLKLNHR